MKKLFYLLLLLPFSMFLSCDKDEGFSPADLTITLSGVTQSNNIFYTIAGENVSIDNLSIKALDGKATDLANVQFYLNGSPIVPTPGYDNLVFSTENFPEGAYFINITGNLLQEGTSIMIFTASYELKIVDNPDNIPADAPEIGTYSQTLRVINNK